jgi:hypothetical protein
VICAECYLEYYRHRRISEKHMACYQALLEANAALNYAQEHDRQPLPDAPRTDREDGP